MGSQTSLHFPVPQIIYIIAIIINIIIIFIELYKLFKIHKRHTLVRHVVFGVQVKCEAVGNDLILNQLDYKLIHIFCWCNLHAVKTIDFFAMGKGENIDLLNEFSPVCTQRGRIGSAHCRRQLIPKGNSTYYSEVTGSCTIQSHTEWLM